jgi:hypothetical protein
MAEVEMTSMPTALDTAKHAADSVLDKYKANANIAMTINNLSADTQSGEFQADTYAYITKYDFDALKALMDAYNTELKVKENEHYRKQLQILTELLSGIEGNHPEFSGGSNKRSNRRSNQRSKKSRSRRTISRRRRSRARR